MFSVKTFNRKTSSIPITDNPHMLLTFPIVGLQYYNDDVAEAIDEISTSPRLTLVWEDSNRYSPYAIAVIWHTQQIGYVNDDYARLIRASLPHSHEAEAVFAEKDTESKKAFWADIEVDEIGEVTIKNTLDLSPIQSLALPDIQREHRMHLELVVEQCPILNRYVESGELVEEDIPVFVQFLEQFKQEYGLSLAGEDRFAALTMEQTMQLTIDWWVDHQSEDTHYLAYDLQEAVWRLNDRHRHYANNPQRCAQLYKNERARVRKELRDSQWLNDYDTILTTQRISLKEEEKRLLNWLYQLPNDCYSYREDISLFASKLFYARLSWQDLMAVYIYEECLEHVVRKQGRNTIVRRKPAAKKKIVVDKIPDITLFTPKYDPADFADFDEAIRATIRQKPYRLIPALIDSIRLNQKYGLIPKDFGGKGKMKAWVTAFNAEYGLRLDYSSFCRIYKQQVKRNPTCAIRPPRSTFEDPWARIVRYGEED